MNNMSLESETVSLQLATKNNMAASDKVCVVCFYIFCSHTFNIVGKVLQLVQNA